MSPNEPPEVRELTSEEFWALMNKRLAGVWSGQVDIPLSGPSLDADAGDAVPDVFGGGLTSIENENLRQWCALFWNPDGSHK